MRLNSAKSPGRSAALAAAILIVCAACGDDIGTSLATPSIRVALDTDALTVEQGSSGIVIVSLERRGGYAGTVDLELSGAPSGVTAGFAPTSLADEGPSSLTLAVAAGAATGDYPLTITARGSGVASRTATLTLTIAPPGTTPTIGVDLDSATVDLVQGQSALVGVTVTRGGGFTGAVALAPSGVPAGVTATLSPTSVTGTASTLTLAAGAGTAPGAYQIIITGTGSGVAAVADTLTLTVTAASTHTLRVYVNAPNDSLWVRQGASRVWEVLIERGGGFAGAVDLTVQGLPAGVTADFLLTTLPPDRDGTSVTLTAAAGTALGSTNVTFRARGTGVPDATIVVKVTVIP